jgi:hypothetical protein
MRRRIAIGAVALGALLAGVLSLFLLLTPPAEQAPLDSHEVATLISSGNTPQGFVRILQVKKALILNVGQRIQDWATGASDDAATPKSP